MLKQRQLSPIFWVAFCCLWAVRCMFSTASERGGPWTKLNLTAGSNSACICSLIQSNCNHQHLKHNRGDFSRGRLPGAPLYVLFGKQLLLAPLRQYLCILPESLQTLSYFKFEICS